MLEGWTTPLKFPPGEGWSYGSGLDWAGRVLERVTGQSLGQYMAENVLQPLGLQDTAFRSLNVKQRTQGRLADCTYREANTRDVQGKRRRGSMIWLGMENVHSLGKSMFGKALTFLSSINRAHHQQERNVEIIPGVDTRRQLSAAKKGSNQQKQQSKSGRQVGRLGI
jgi:CubicO group peptidase (beta-lactamase class C family)